MRKNMKFRFFPFILSFLLSTIFAQVSFAQCPSIEFIMANACDDANNPESDAEFMIISSGGGFNVDDLTVDFDTNNNGSGSTNADIGPTSGCGFMFPFGIQLQDMGSPPPCPNVVLVGPGQSVPPNVLVVILTSSAFTGDTYDWTPLCGAGQQVYVMQSDCDRTIGAFTDGTGSSSTRTTGISTPGCNDALTYDRMNLVLGDGDYVMDDGAGGLNYGNGCAPPAIPLPCTPPGFANPGPQTECGSYTLPNITGTDLTGNEAYYTQTNGGGTMHNAGDDITTTTTLFIYDTSAPCDEVSFTVTINPVPTAIAPASDVLLCVTIIPPALVSDNIADVEAEITGGDAALTVNWYTDAAGTSPINITNAAAVLALGPPPVTVYASVSDGNSCESATVPVTVNAEEAPNASPASGAACDDGSGMHDFDLTDYESTINGGTGNAVTYYSDAAGTMVIADPTAFSVTAPSGTAYASVSSPNGCLSAPEAITLSITPAPDLSTIDFTATPLSACNSTNVDLTFTLPSAGVFDITMEADIAGIGVQTVNFMVMNGETVTFPVAIDGTTVFTITAASGGACPGTGMPNATQTVTIFNQPDIAPINDVEACDSYLLPSIPYDDFPVGDGAYYTGPGATGTQYLPGQTITASVLPLYVYASVAPGCSDEESFNITITPIPVIDPIMDVVACGSYTLPNFFGTDLSPGHTYFTQPNGNGAEMTIGTNITTSMTLYAFDGTAPDCFDEVAFDITITPPPSIDNIPDVTSCGSYVLPDFTGVNLSVNHTYYTQPNGGGAALSVGATITSDVTLYAFDGTVPDCFDEEMFAITILPQPTIDPIGDETVCGSYTLPDFTGMNLSADHTYYTQPNGGGSEVTIGTQITSTTTLYAFDGTAPDCYAEEAFTITITPTPILNLVGNNIICAGDEVDISTLVVDIVGTGYPITYHSSSPATVGNLLPTTLVGPPVSTSYFAFIDGGTSACQVELEIPVIVDPAPIALPTNMDVCDNGTGEGNFDLTTLENFISDGSGAPVLWYLDEMLNFTINSPSDFVSTSTIVYAVTDNGACISDPVEIDLTVIPPFTVSVLEGAGVLCFGGEDASLATIITGATPNFSYDWNDDAFDGVANPTGVGAGTYMVTVTDGNMCTATGSITVDQPEELMIICGQQSPVSAVGGDDGVGVVDIFGNTPDYTISWAGAETGTMVVGAEGTYTIPNLMAGNYNITVTDGNNCVKTCDFTIADPSCPMFLEIGGGHPACPGEETGFINLTVNNGMEPLIFDWNFDEYDGMEDLINLGAGNYRVTVTGADGCFVTTNLNLTDPAPLSLSCSQSIPPSTVGGTDGQGTITFDGGTPGYTISWTGPVPGMQVEVMPGMILLDNLSAGTYLITLTDANDCTTDCSFDVVDPGCNFGATGVSANVDCNGASTGSIDLMMIGGTSPFTFDWSDDTYDGTEDPMNIPAGFYFVTVTDAALCTANVTIQVLEPDALTLTCAESSQVSMPGGNDGVATLDIGGGIAPYTINWTGAAAGMQTAGAAGMVMISDLVAGDYMVTVTDANNCTITCDFTITEVQPGCNMSLMIANTPNDCFGESQASINLTITGAVGMPTIDWSDDTLDGEEDPTGLEAGTYTVTVTDANDCVEMISTTIVDPAELTLSCSESSQVSTPGGNDGVATLDIGGGVAPYTINWTGAAAGMQTAGAVGMVMISDLVAGDYMVVVTDNNDCEVQCNFAISGVGCDLQVNIIPTSQTCPGEDSGSILLEITGGVEPLVIDWSDDALDGELNPVGLPPGLYQVTVSDAIGCEIANSTMLTVLFENPTMTIDAPASICNTECADIDLHFEGIPPFLAQVTIVELGFNTVLSAFIQDTTYTFCPQDLGITDGTFTIQATEVADANCSQVVDVVSQIQIDQPGTFLLEQTLCMGEEVMVNGQVYDEGTPMGIETISGASANGCDSIVTINLSFLPAATASLLGEQTICDGEVVNLSIALSDNEAYDVTFSDGVNLPIVYTNVSNGFTIQVNPAVTTNYFIHDVVGSGQGCPVSIEHDQVTVTVSQLQAVAEVVSPISCGGTDDGVIRVLADMGIQPYTYQWSPEGGDTPQIANLSAGTYTVTVEDAAGCRVETEETLEASEVFEMRVSSVDANCLYEASGAITIEEVLGGSGNLEYSLDGEFFETIGSVPFVIPQLAAGVYTVFVQDENACLAEATVVVNPANELLLEIRPASETINLGDSILLEGMVNFTAADIQWNPTETLSDPESLVTFAKPMVSTTYTLLVTDEAGCTAQNFVNILVNKETPIFIPNVFSPNGDGANDLLFINARINSIQEIRSFNIYDRWGEIVFTAEHFMPNDPAYGWDGKLDGRTLNPAVFVYAAEVEFVDGRVEVLTGDVVLVR